MARYKKYTVIYGDTIQSIAQQEMGSVQNWEDIIDYNNLDYPYLVDTVAEKMQNPNRLKTIGDTIIIPIEVDLLDTDVESLGHRDRELILGLALGRDLALSYIEHTSGNKGNFNEAFGFDTSNRGDIKTVSGIENLKQATINRLLTPRGSLLLYPTYGSNLHRILGRYNTNETLVMLDNEIQSTIKKDSRVQDIEVVSSYIEEDNYYGEFDVFLYEFQDYFNLVVSNDDGGAFTIT